jgi:hypothetical protein
MTSSIQLFIGRSLTAVLIGGVTVMSATSPRTQTLGTKETRLMVQRALSRLPYYGVFDFLVFGVNRGLVSVGGFAYRANLKSDASAAIKRVGTRTPGMDPDAASRPSPGAHIGSK